MRLLYVCVITTPCYGHWCLAQTATCDGFEVGQHQCLSKFHFLDYSSVVVTMCKHVCFQLQAVMNMNRGEAYVTPHFMVSLTFANRGFSFIYSNASQHATLQGTEDHEECAMTYNVICITICHIVAYWHKFFPELTSPWCSYCHKSSNSNLY